MRTDPTGMLDTDPEKEKWNGGWTDAHRELFQTFGDPSGFLSLMGTATGVTDGSTGNSEESSEQSEASSSSSNNSTSQEIGTRIYDQTSFLFGAAGQTVGLAGASTEIGKSFWYSMNDYSKPIGQTYFKEISMFQKWGRVARGTGGLLTLAFSTVDAVGVRNYYKYSSGNGLHYTVHPGKAGLNTGIGVYSLFGAPYAAIPLGAIYFGVDNYYPGGWPAAHRDQDGIIRQNQAILGDHWNMYSRFW
jgi:hypothetical protein